MKKTLSLLLTLALLVSCGAVLAEAANPEQKVGTYQLINKTGEGIVRISISDNKSDAVSTVEYNEAPLPPDTLVVLSLGIPADEDGEHRLTLSYTTESGKTGTFATLSIEEVSIELLDVDAVAGATPIRFGMPRKIGVYRVVNQTGAPVSTVTITDNVTGDSREYALNLAPDAEATVSFSIDGKEDGEHRLTFSFVGEDGETRSFGTLSIEEVTVNLLAADAMTGATPIQFAPMPKAE